MLTFALAVPFWVLGMVTDHQWLPGVPAAASMFLCPGLAAIILAYREGGIAGLRSLLRRAIDYRSIPSKLWYVPLILITPTISAVSWFALRALGAPIPAPNITIFMVFALPVLCLVTAACEELGWSGYAIDTMQARWGALRASLLLGAFWAIWHWVPLIQVHRAAPWIAWWTLWTVSARVIMTWLYNLTGCSVLGAIVYHATSNVCWQAFPIQGSYWDPRVTGLVTACLAVALISARTLTASKPSVN